MNKYIIIKASHGITNERLFLSTFDIISGEKTSENISVYQCNHLSCLIICLGFAMYYFLVIFVYFLFECPKKHAPIITVKHSCVKLYCRVRSEWNIFSKQYILPIMSSNSNLSHHHSFTSMCYIQHMTSCAYDLLLLPLLYDKLRSVIVLQ